MAFGDNRALTHTYAFPNNAIKLKVLILIPNDFKPEVSVAVAAGGATVTFTPTNDNLVGGLLYFKAIICDESQNYASATLDLATPSVAFVADTSALNVNQEWTVQFSAAKQAPDDVTPARVELEFPIATGTIAAGGTILIKLQSYVYFKAAIDNSAGGVQNAIVNGGTAVVPASPSLADIKAAIEEALSVAGIVGTQFVTVVDGTAANTIDVTVNVADDNAVVITVTDQAAAAQVLVLQ